MIRELICNILELLEDALKYATLAIKYKTKCPTASSLYKELSEEELLHASKQLDLVRDRITLEDKNIWEWLEEDIIKHTALIMAMHELI